MDIDEDTHARIKKFCQRGSNFDNVFFVLFFLIDEGREIQVQL